MAEPRLSAVSRAMALQYKVYDRMRHPRAFEVAREVGTAPDLASLSGARQCLVVTFRRSGEPVPTPVNFGLSGDDRLYFRSEPHVAKVRRIQRDPHVRVCACNLRGKPLGPVVEGVARILAEDEIDPADRAIAANWSWWVRPYERGAERIGVPMAYVEITPAST